MKPLGQVAYEAIPEPSPHHRVSWEQLTPTWREYWMQIAIAVETEVQRRST